MTAIIEGDLSNVFPREIYMMTGRVVNKDGSTHRIAHWTRTGIYNIDKKSEFDIVF